MASDSITINLTDTQVTEAVTAAIMNLLTDDLKKQVLEGAVKYLLGVPEPSSHSYYNLDKRTRLQRAFDDAVDQMAYRVVREYVEQDAEFRAQMVLLVRQQAADAILEDSRLREAITRAVVQTVAEWKPERD